jgi:Concanavalin A-like lectin/glucanases superfamily
MRVVILASLVTACGFAPMELDVQPDAQPNGGPTIPLSECHSQLADLRLCLDFEDSTLAPVIRDESIGGHDAASAFITPYPRAGQHSAALDYGSLIAVPESADLDIPQHLTIEMWLNPDSRASAWALYNTAQYGLGIDNGELYCQFGNHVIHANEAFAVDEWTHVACTWDGSTVKAYVDGDVSDCRTDEPDTIANVNLAGTSVGLGYYGAIDDVHVYARTLADAEIWTLAGVTDGTTECPGGNHD